MGHDTASKPKREEAEKRADGVDTVYPGKHTQVGAASGVTGDEYLDRGALCDRETNNPECILSPRKRDQLVAKLGRRMDKACKNYQLAIVRLQMENLLKTDSDLSWVVTLILDTASAHLLGAVVRGADTLRKKVLAAVEKQASMIEIDGVGIDVAGAKTDHFLAKITDRNIQANLKGFTDAGKRSVASALKARKNRELREQKDADASYLAMLQSNADLEYSYVADHAPVSMSDVELISLLQAMDPEQHTIEIYYQVLSEKLARFESSGVKDIGHNLNADERVAWASFTSGYPRELVIERSSVDSSFAMRGGVARGQADDGQKSYKAIPQEFWEVAIERHRAAFETEPRQVHIDDSYDISDPIRQMKA